MDAATSPAVTTPPLRVLRDARPILVGPELVVADISDRAVRMALLLGYHEDPDDDATAARGFTLPATALRGHVLAGLLRCTTAEVSAAWAELAAVGALLPARHSCADVDW